MHAFGFSGEGVVRCYRKPICGAKDALEPDQTDFLAQGNKIDLNGTHKDFEHDLVVGQRGDAQASFRTDVGDRKPSVQCVVTGKTNGAHRAQNFRSGEWEGAGTRFRNGHESGFGLLD